MDLPPIITVECHTVVIGFNYLMQCTMNVVHIADDTPPS